MDVVKIVMPEQVTPNEFVMPIADVSGIKRKFLDVAYADQSEKQKIDIYLPDEGEGPFPVVFFIHGGAFWGGERRDFQISYVIDGIRRGYAVVSLEHRLSQEVKFPQPLFDAKAAIRFLRAHAKEYCLDADRICSIGASAGGYFAAMLATSAGIPALEDKTMGNAEFDSGVQACIGLFGVYDLAMQSQFTEDTPAMPGFPKMANFADQFMDLSCRDYPGLMRLAWPGAYVRPDCPPMLIQAGTKDEIVPYQNSPDLVNAVNAVCGEGRAIMEPFEGCAHGDIKFAAPENIDRLFRFMDEHLK